VRLGHPAHADDQRRVPQRDPVGPGPLRHGGVRRAHPLLQPVLDLALGPPVGLLGLHPLEVRDDHAAGVRQDVRHDGDPAVGQHPVALAGGRAVRALHHPARLDRRGGVLVQHVLGRGGDQHVDVERQQLRVRQRVGAREADDGAGLGDVAQQRGDVQAARRVHAAVLVADRHDPRAALGEEPRRVRADLAEALHGGGHLGQLGAGVGQRRGGGVHDAP
jgi:hypothetical protein